MNVIDSFNAAQCRKDIPDFRVGDTVRVHQKIVEGERERIQVFEGVVISRKGGSATETFIVRRISFGVGVERIFPVHSPRIDKIEVMAQGLVRRAKLYYLRDRVGKAARVRSKQLRKGEGRLTKTKAVVPETPPEPEKVASDAAAEAAAQAPPEAPAAATGSDAPAKTTTETPKE